MRKIFTLLVSSLLILSSCKENVKAQVDDKTDIVQEDEVNNLNDTELNSAAAYYNRSLAKDDLEDYKGAIADYTKAIEIDPNYAYAYNNRGIAKYYSGDKNGACKDARKAEELGGDVSQFINAECN